MGGKSLLLFHHSPLGFHVLRNVQLPPSTFGMLYLGVLAESFRLTSEDMRGGTPPTDDRINHRLNKEVIHAAVGRKS